jgi:hypothetical protein
MDSDDMNSRLTNKRSTVEGCTLTARINNDPLLLTIDDVHHRRYLPVNENGRIDRAEILFSEHESIGTLSGRLRSMSIDHEGPNLRMNPICTNEDVGMELRAIDHCDCSSLCIL